jgi:acyl-CoA thioester hydrolase
MAEETPGKGDPPGRDAFPRLMPIATRWADNDVYGHLNNVIYYALFDSAVNTILVEAGLLDPATSPVVGLVVESHCRFFASLAYPDPVEIGVGIEHIGRSSVRYRFAAFGPGSPTAAAVGGYTHVYVDRAANRPVPIPDAHRRLMETLKV